MSDNIFDSVSNWVNKQRENIAGTVGGVDPLTASILRANNNLEADPKARAVGGAVGAYYGGTALAGMFGGESAAAGGSYSADAYGTAAGYGGEGAATYGFGMGNAAAAGFAGAGASDFMGDYGSTAGSTGNMSGSAADAFYGDTAYGGPSDPTLWQRMQQGWGGLKGMFSGSGGGSAASGGLGMLSGPLGIYGGLQMLAGGKDVNDPNMGAYRDKLADTYAHPDAYLKSPDYQATYGAGLQGLQRQYAAGGYGGTGADPGKGGGSGNFSTAVQSYGQNAAAQYLGNYRAGLVPLTQSNPQSNMQQMGGYASLLYGLSKMGW